MPIQNITYQTLVDLVKNYIKTNCKNISDFASISSVMKSGYSTSATISSAGDGYTSSYTCTISKAVAQVDTSTVDTDMTNFLSTIGVSSKLSSNIPEGEFIKFFNDMVSFCSTKMAFATSQFTTTKYLIYNTGSTSYASTVTIGNNTARQLIKVTDITTITNMLTSVMKQTLRTIPCTYTYSFA